VYVDATLGGGGHALEILKRTGPDGLVVGIDWDEDALSEARKSLKPFEGRARIVRGNFSRLPEILGAMGIAEVDGILLDLGLSSIQLEKRERRFSFRGDGPLDMRMDQRRDVTAADLINHLSLDELERTLSEYGEERWAKKIAKAIVAERAREPIETTQQLRKIVWRAVPRRYQSRRVDPATRTFQAFRIRVNDEFENLKQFLGTGWKALKKGGRICIISFHSLEDRMVKESFRRLEKGEGEGKNEKGVLRVITKKVIVPSGEELRNNPRSRSAKLRCAERL
jgi:16S rRNA (cytosine1402-N4)-methyltransferase